MSDTVKASDISPATVAALKSVLAVPSVSDMNAKVNVADVVPATDLLNNTALTGVPTAPTAVQGTNTTQIATTAGVFTETTIIKTKNTFGESLKLMADYRMGTIFPVGLDGSQALAVSVNLSSGRKYFCTIVLQKPTLVTGYKFSVLTAGVYTADAVNGISIHSMAHNASTEITGTKVTSATMWSVAGAITVPLTTPITLPAGEYKVYVLYHSSAQTTAPTLTGLTVGELAGIDANNSFSGYNNVIGYFLTQTDLTATQTPFLFTAKATSQVPLITLY